MVDITIRGAGIFGLSIAWTCARRGAAVRVVDPQGPMAGASGGLVGALAPHVPENWNPKKAFQLDSLLAAERFWSDVADASGHDPGYARNGRLQPIADAAALELARAREDTAKELWQDHARWTVTDTPASEFRPHSPTGYWIHDTLSALIHPRQGCRALVEALLGKGVAIVTEAPDSGPTLWATGAAGLAALGEGRQRMVGTRIKGQAALLAYDARNAPQIFAGGLHVIPHGDATVAVGSTTERTYDSPDTTDTALDQIIDTARTLVPALRQAPVIERWAGLRPRARSRAPILGHWPGRPGHYIANGGFKIGFGMAPLIAEVMADLLLEGRDRIPAGFRVEDSL